MSEEKNIPLWQLPFVLALWLLAMACCWGFAIGILGIIGGVITLNIFNVAVGGLLCLICYPLAKPFWDSVKDTDPTGPGTGGWMG